MQTPILHTERLTLRSISMDDAASLFPLFNKISIEDYSYKIEAPHEMRLWIELALQLKVAPWVVLLDGQPIGLVDISPEPGEGDWEVGYFIDIEYQRQGYASEALYCALKWGIDNIGLDNVKAGITAHNTASRKLVEKLGFTFVRAVAKDWEWRGKVYDSVYYILKKENLIKP